MIPVDRIPDQGYQGEEQMGENNGEDVEEERALPR